MEPQSTSTPLVTRRAHTKSRKGCTNCKRRKVKAWREKCDEAYPSCFNCKRYNVLCSLASPSPSKPELSTERARRTERGALFPSDSQSPAVTTSPAHGTPTNPSSPPPQNGILELGNLFSSGNSAQSSPKAPWSRDAELMHHYCTVTAGTLAIRKDVIHLMKVIIPQKGYTHDFVMHGILALAATHKALLVPSQFQTYVNVSAYHQVLGSEGFRASTSEINNENWRAMFSFSLIVGLYYMTLPIRSERQILEVPIHSIAELFSAVKGVRASVEPFAELIHGSELEPIIASNRSTLPAHNLPSGAPSLDHSPLPTHSFEALHRLRDFYQVNCPEASRQHYIDAVDRLEQCCKRVVMDSMTADPRLLMAWAYIVPDTVIGDLRAFGPHAMLLAAYFATLIGCFENSFWYVRGWAKATVNDVDRRVVGWPEFAELMVWPREQVAGARG